MEIAIISGKGGTGKSSISAAFATIGEKVVLADCDVDAANLYLIFNPTHDEEQVYIAGYKAYINKDLCIECKICMDYCKFDAISLVENKVEISEVYCDGCKLCSRICPTQAISMTANDKSRMYAGDFRNGKMVYGRLSPGEENSGKLVNIVRDKAKQIAKQNNIDTIIIDGPPGIGCAVISSITGVDSVLIVTEPTISGLHDLVRTIEICSKFQMKTWVLINKYDLNKDMSDEIERYCVESNIKIAGKIKFNSNFVNAMILCKSIIEYMPYSEDSKQIIEIFNLIKNTE